MNRKLRRLHYWVALVALVGGAAQAQAQSAVISGRVVSTQGQPLLGANVYITEMNLSVGTNQQGVYTITVPAARVTGQSAVLRVRSVGFAPMERTISVTPGTQTVDFTMRPDAIQLSEMIVTGTTAATEAVRVPFAVARVDSAMMPVVGANAIAQLQGKVPGAQVVGAGRPGAAPTIVLRGVSSLNASGRSQSPLYIVDGVLLDADLPDINPADIENIEVVNGAAAASLYGARAGSGVINITTKKGRGAEGVKFSARTEYGAGDIERRWPTATTNFMAMDPTGQYFCSRETVGGSPCARYIDIYEEQRRVNDQPLDNALTPQGFLRDGGIATAPTYQALTGSFQVNPWPKTFSPVDQLVTPSAFSNTNLDVRGSVGEGTNFYASLSNFTQQGAVRYLDGYRRNAGRLNLEHKFNDQLSMGVNTYYARTQEDGANLDNTGSGGPWFTITRTPAFVDLNQRDQYGRLFIRTNPLAQGSQNGSAAYPLENLTRVDRGGRFIGGMNLRYEPLEWLTLGTNLGFDRSQGEYTSFRDRGARSTTVSPSTAGGAITQLSFDNQSFNGQLDATAQKSFGELETTVLARYLYSQRDGSDMNLFGQNLVVPGLETADAATEGYTIGSSRQSIREVGVAGGVNLTYKSRYILDGTVRRDGSSLFGPDNRWATFGRISGTWIATEEEWWPAPEALSLFKLRANYGTSGNSPRFSAQYETFTIGTGGTLNPSTLGNRDLKPEVKTETELGVDLELFNRAGVSVTYADAKINDQILQVKPPTASGFQTQWQNAGEIQNKTWEVSLNLPVINREDVSYSTRFIYDRTRSTITRLDVPPYTGTITAANTYTVYQFREGEQIGTFYGTAFAKSCGDLPANFAAQCGGSGKAFQANSDGYIVWVGEGNAQNEGVTKNLWTSNLPADQSPYGVRANWGMPIVLRDSTATPLFARLGNGMPDFHLGWSHNVRYKRLSAYALVDASVGQDIWNISYAWSLGDFMTGEQDQTGKSVEEAKPIGYWWRRGPGGPGGSSGIGGFYDNLGPNTFNTEDGSYTKLREVRLDYRVGAIGGVGDWSVGVVGRNLYTWTNFRGWDPETGQTGGDLNSSALNAVAGYRFPNMRTFTLQLATSF